MGHVSNWKLYISEFNQFLSTRTNTPILQFVFPNFITPRQAIKIESNL